jgi:hypothetical protein
MFQGRKNRILLEELLKENGYRSISEVRRKLSHYYKKLYFPERYKTLVENGITNYARTYKQGVARKRIQGVGYRAVAKFN